MAVKQQWCGIFEELFTHYLEGYQVDEASCAFIRAHPACEWTLYFVKGFQNDLGDNRPGAR